MVRYRVIYESSDGISEQWVECDLIVNDAPLVRFVKKQTEGEHSGWGDEGTPVFVIPVQNLLFAGIEAEDAEPAHGG